VRCGRRPTRDHRDTPQEISDLGDNGSGVLTGDLIETWVAYKRENELDPIRLRPHPHEFELYYDV
jgi:glutamine synthetase